MLVHRFLPEFFQGSRDQVLTVMLLPLRFFFFAALLPHIPGFEFAGHEVTVERLTPVPTDTPAHTLQLPKNSQQLRTNDYRPLMIDYRFPYCENR
jgi:hypothetical protein